MPIRMLGPDGQVYDVEEQNVSQAVAMGGDFYDANDNFQFFNPSDGTVSKINKAGIRNAVSAGMRPVARSADKTIRMIGSDMRQYDVKPEMLSQAFSMGGQLILKPDSLLINPNDPLTWPEQEGKDNTGKKSTDLTRPKSIGDAFAEVLDRPLSYLPYLNTVDIFEATKQYKAAKAAEEGTITPEQSEYLNAVTADQQRDRTFGYKAADIILRMPAFAVEFMTAGGAIKGLSKRALVKAADGKLKRIGKREAISLAGKLGVRQTDNYAEQLARIQAARSVSDLTEVAVRAAGPAGLTNAKSISQKAVVAASDLNLFDIPESAGTAVAQFFLKDTTGDVMRAAARVGADRKAFLAAKKAGKDLSRFTGAGLLPGTGDEAAKALGASLLSAAVIGAGPRQIFSAGRIANLAVANMTPVFGLQPDDQGNMQRVLAKESDDFWPAIAKAYGDMAIENLSEAVGENFLFLKGFFGDQAKNAFKSAWVATHADQLAKKLQKSAPGTVSDTAAWAKRTATNFLFGKNGDVGFLEKAGFNGYFAELGEEAVGGVLRQAFGISPVGLPSLEDVAAMAVGFAINPLAIGGMAYDSANQLIADSTSKVMDKVKSGEAFRSAEDLAPIADEIRTVAEKFSRRPTGLFDGMLNSMFRLPYARAQARAIGRAMQPGTEGETIAEELGLVQEAEKGMGAFSLDVRGTMMMLEDFGNIIKRARERESGDLSAKSILPDSEISAALHKNYGLNFASSEVDNETLGKLNDLRKRGLVYSPVIGFTDTNRRIGLNQVVIKTEDPQTSLSDQEFNDLRRAFPWLGRSVDLNDLTEEEKKLAPGQVARALVTLKSSTTKDDLLMQLVGAEELSSLPVDPTTGERDFDVNNKKLVDATHSILRRRLETPESTEAERAQAARDAFYDNLAIAKALPTDPTFQLDIGPVTIAEGTQEDFDSAFEKGYADLASKFKPVRMTEDKKPVFRLMINGLTKNPDVTESGVRWNSIFLANSAFNGSGRNAALGHEIIQKVLGLYAPSSSETDHTVSGFAGAIRSAYRDLAKAKDRKSLSGNQVQAINSILTRFANNDQELITFQLEASLGLTTSANLDSLAREMADLLDIFEMPPGIKNVFDQKLQSQSWKTDALENLLKVAGATRTLADLDSGGVVKVTEEEGKPEAREDKKTKTKTPPKQKTKDELVQENAKKAKSVSLPDWGKLKEALPDGTPEDIRTLYDNLATEQAKYKEVRADSDFYYVRFDRSGKFSAFRRMTTNSSVIVGFQTSVSKEAADLGTRFHTVVSLIQRGVPSRKIAEQVGPKSELPAQVEETVAALAEQIERIRAEITSGKLNINLNNMVTEVFLADQDTNIAGTIDALYLNPETGKIQVWDWKTMLGVPWDTDVSEISKVEIVSRKLREYQDTEAYPSTAELEAITTKDGQDTRKAHKHRWQVSGYADMVKKKGIVRQELLDTKAAIVPVSRSEKDVKNADIKDLKAENEPIQFTIIPNALELMEAAYEEKFPTSVSADQLPDKPVFVSRATVDSLNPEKPDKVDGFYVYQGTSGVALFTTEGEGAYNSASVVPLGPRNVQEYKIYKVKDKNLVDGQMYNGGITREENKVPVKNLPQLGLRVQADFFNNGPVLVPAEKAPLDGTYKGKPVYELYLKYSEEGERSSGGENVVTSSILATNVEGEVTGASKIINKIIPDKGFIIRNEKNQHLFIPGSMPFVEAKELITRFVKGDALGLEEVSLTGKKKPVKPQPPSSDTNDKPKPKSSPEKPEQGEQKEELPLLPWGTGEEGNRLSKLFEDIIKKHGSKISRKEYGLVQAKIFEDKESLDIIFKKKLPIDSYIENFKSNFDKWKQNRGPSQASLGGLPMDSMGQGPARGRDEINKLVDQALQILSTPEKGIDPREIDFISALLRGERGSQFSAALADVIVNAPEINQSVIDSLSALVSRYVVERAMSGSEEQRDIGSEGVDEEDIGEDSFGDEDIYGDLGDAIFISDQQRENFGRKILSSISKNLGLGQAGYYRVYEFFKDPIARSILSGVNGQGETVFTEQEMLDILADESLFREQFLTTSDPAVRRAVLEYLNTIKRNQEKREEPVSLRQTYLTSVLSFANQELLPIHRMEYFKNQPVVAQQVLADVNRIVNDRLSAVIQKHFKNKEDAVAFLSRLLLGDTPGTLEAGQKFSHEQWLRAVPRSYLFSASRNTGTVDEKGKHTTRRLNDFTPGQLLSMRRNEEFFFVDSNGQPQKLDFDKLVNLMSELTGLNPALLYAGFAYGNAWERNFLGATKQIVTRLTSLFAPDTRTTVAPIADMSVSELQKEFISSIASRIKGTTREFPSFLTQLSSHIDLYNVPRALAAQAEEIFKSTYSYRGSRGRLHSGLRARTLLADSLDEQGREWRILDFGKAQNRTTTYDTGEFGSQDIDEINRLEFTRNIDVLDTYWQYFGRFGSKDMIVQVKVNRPTTVAQALSLRKQAAKELLDSGFTESELNSLIPSEEYIRSVPNKDGVFSNPETNARAYEVAYALNSALLQIQTVGSPFATFADPNTPVQKKLEKMSSYPKRTESSLTPGFLGVLNLPNGLGETYTELLIDMSGMEKSLVPDIDGFDLMVNDEKFRIAFGDLMALSHEAVKAGSVSEEEFGRWTAAKPIHVGRDVLRKSSTGLLEFLAETQPNSLYSTLASLTGVKDGKGSNIDFIRIRTASKLEKKGTNVVKLSDLVEVDPQTNAFTLKAGARDAIEGKLNELKSKDFKIILEQRSTTKAQPKTVAVQLQSSMITDGNTDVIDELEEIRKVLSGHFFDIVDQAMVGEDGRINLVYLQTIANEHMRDSSVQQLVNSLVDTHGTYADYRSMSPVAYEHLSSVLHTFLAEYANRVVLNSVYSINTPSGKAQDSSLTTETAYQYNSATGSYVALDRNAEGYREALDQGTTDLKTARVFTNIVNGRDFESIEEMFFSEAQARAAAAIRVLENPLRYVDMLRPGVYDFGIGEIISKELIQAKLTEAQANYKSGNYVAALNGLREVVLTVEIDTESGIQGNQQVWRSTIPSQPVFWMRVPASSGAATGYGRVSRKIAGGESQLIMSYEDSKKAGADHDGDKWFVFTMVFGSKGTPIVQEKLYGDQYKNLPSNVQAFANQSFLKMMDHFYTHKDTHILRYDPIDLRRLDEVIDEEIEFMGKRKETEESKWMFGREKQMLNVEESRTGVKVRGVFAANNRIYKVFGRSKTPPISAFNFDRLVKAAAASSKEESNGYTLVKNDEGNLVLEYKPKPGAQERGFRLVFGTSDRLNLTLAPDFIDTLLQLAVDNEKERKLALLGITYSNASYVTALLTLNPELHRSGATRENYVDYFRQIVRFLKQPTVSEFFSVLDNRNTPSGRRKISKINKKTISEDAYREPFMKSTPDQLYYSMKYIMGQVANEYYQLYRLMSAGQRIIRSNRTLQEINLLFDHAMLANDNDRRKHPNRRNVASQAVTLSRKQDIPDPTKEGQEDPFRQENDREYEERTLTRVQDAARAKKESLTPLVVYFDAQNEGPQGRSEEIYSKLNLKRNAEGVVTDEDIVENVAAAKYILGELEELSSQNINFTLLLFGRSGVSGLDVIAETAPNTFYEIQKVFAGFGTTSAFKLLNVSNIFTERGSATGEQLLTPEGENLRSLINANERVQTHNTSSTRLAQGLLRQVKQQIKKEKADTFVSPRDEASWLDRALIRMETVLQVQAMPDSFYLADSTNTEDERNGSLNYQLASELVELQEAFPNHPLYSSLYIDERKSGNTVRPVVSVLPAFSMSTSTDLLEQARGLILESMTRGTIGGVKAPSIPDGFLQRLYAASLLEYGMDTVNSSVTESPLKLLPIQAVEMFKEGMWKERDLWNKASPSYEKFLWERYKTYLMRKQFGLVYGSYKPAVSQEAGRHEERQMRPPPGKGVTSAPDVIDHDVAEGLPKNVYNLSQSAGVNMSFLVSMAKGANLASQIGGAAGVSMSGVYLYSMDFEYLGDVTTDEEAKKKLEQSGGRLIDGTGMETFRPKADYDYRNIQQAPYAYASLEHPRPVNSTDAIKKGKKTSLAWSPGTTRSRPVPAWLSTDGSKRQTISSNAAVGDIIKIISGNEVLYLSVTREPRNLDYLVQDLLFFRGQRNKYQNLNQLPTADKAGKYSNLMSSKLKYIPEDLAVLPRDSNGRPLSISMLLQGSSPLIENMLAFNDKVAPVFYTALVNQQARINQTLRETPEEAGKITYPMTVDVLKSVEDLAEAVLVFENERQLSKVATSMSTRGNLSPTMNWLSRLATRQSLQDMGGREAIAAIKAAMDAAKVSSSAFLFAGEGSIVERNGNYYFSLDNNNNVSDLLHAVGLVLGNSTNLNGNKVDTYVFDEVSNQWFRVPLFSADRLTPLTAEDVNIIGDHFVLASPKIGENSAKAAQELFNKADPGGPGTKETPEQPTSPQVPPGGSQAQLQGPPADQDRAYMDAVEAGDMDTAQKMVDEAAKAAGAVVGWRVGGIRDGSRNYFTESEASSIDYFYGKDRPSTVPKIGANQRTTRAKKYYLFGNQISGNFSFGKGSLKSGEIGRGQIDGSGGVVELVTSSSDNIKSADPVTRDDQGNVIPLSERFNPKESDITPAAVKVRLPITGPYTKKDQIKSDKANKFIGRGSPRSSTAAYAKAWGDRANTGVYEASDTVFVSVEGNRAGRIGPNLAELQKALDAGATIITDIPADRLRSYNVGERAVSTYLQNQGYKESEPGTWTPEGGGSQAQLSGLQKTIAAGVMAAHAAGLGLVGYTSKPRVDLDEQGSVKVRTIINNQVYGGELDFIKVEKEQLPEFFKEAYGKFHTYNMKDVLEEVAKELGEDSRSAIIRFNREVLQDPRVMRKLNNKKVVIKIARSQDEYYNSAETPKAREAIKNSAAHYSPNGDYIVINGPEFLNRPRNRGILILHEIIHDYTVKLLEADPEFNRKITALREGLLELDPSLVDLKGIGGLPFSHYFENNREFLAGISDPAFVDELMMHNTSVDFDKGNEFNKTVHYVATGFAKIQNTKNPRKLNLYEYAIESLLTAIENYTTTELSLNALEGWPEDFEPKRQQEASIAFLSTKGIAPLEKTMFEITKGDSLHLTKAGAFKLRSLLQEASRAQSSKRDLQQFEDSIAGLGYTEQQSEEIIRIFAAETPEGNIDVASAGIHHKVLPITPDGILSGMNVHTVPGYVKEILSSGSSYQAQLSGLTSWTSPGNPFIGGAQRDSVFKANNDLANRVMQMLWDEQMLHSQALEILGVNGDYIRKMTAEDGRELTTNARILREKNKFALKGKVTDADRMMFKEFASAITEILGNKIALSGAQDETPGARFSFSAAMAPGEYTKNYEISWSKVIEAESLMIEQLLKNNKNWRDLRSYGSIVQGLGAVKLGRVPANLNDLLKPDRELFEAGKKEIWKRLVKSTKVIWGREGSMLPVYKVDENGKKTGEIEKHEPRENDEESAESVERRWKESKHYKRLVGEGGRTKELVSMEYWATKKARHLDSQINRLNNIHKEYLGTSYLLPRMAYAPRSNPGLGILSPEEERFMYARERELATLTVSQPVIDGFSKSRYDGRNAFQPSSKPTDLQKRVYKVLSGNSFTGGENQAKADEKIYALLYRELGKELIAKRKGKTLDPNNDGLSRNINVGTEDRPLQLPLDQLFKHMTRDIIPILRSPLNTTAQETRQFDTWNERSRVTGELPSTLDIFDLSKEYTTKMFDTIRTRLVITTAITTKDMTGRPEAFLDLDDAFDYRSKKSIVPESALQTMVDNWVQYLKAEGMDYKHTPTEPLPEQIKRIARMLDSIPRERANRRQEGLSGYEKFGEGTVQGVRALYVNRGWSANAVKMVADRPWTKEITVPFLNREIDVARAAMDISQGSKVAAVAFSAFFPLAGIEQQMGYWSQFEQFWKKPLSFLGSGQFKLAEGVTVEGYKGFVKALFNRSDADINRLISDFTRMGLVLDLSKNSDVMIAEIDNMAKRLSNWLRIEGTVFRKALIPGEAIFKMQARYTKFLFGEFFPMLKMHSAYLIYKKAENEYLEIFKKPWSEHHRTETIKWIAQQMNDGFGGQNWSSYKFATPKMMQTLNLGFFAFNWTMSTANTFGLNKILEVLGVGPEVKSPQIRQMVLANSLMLGTALLLWPQLLQAMIYASFGDPDEKDKMFTLQNEQGKMLHVDFTPIMRKLPWYTGDQTGERRYYMRWGKQMYEVVDGWLTDAERTFFSKMSLPAQMLMQQFTGRQPGSDFTMPFKDGGLLGLFWTREEGVLGSRLAHIGSMFLPFSVQAISGSSKEAFLAGTFASVSKGKSKGVALDELTKVFVTYGWPSVWPGLNNKPQGQENLRALAYGIVDAAQRNGFPTKDLIDDARGKALGKLYRGAIEALNDGDFDKFDGFARGIMRINGTAAGLMRSIESGEVSFGKLKVEMTPEIQEAIRQSFSE